MALGLSLQLVAAWRLLVSAGRIHLHARKAKNKSVEMLNVLKQHILRTTRYKVHSHAGPTRVCSCVGLLVGGELTTLLYSSASAWLAATSLSWCVLCRCAVCGGRGGHQSILSLQFAVNSEWCTCVHN